VKDVLWLWEGATPERLGVISARYLRCGIPRESVLLPVQKPGGFSSLC